MTPVADDERRQALHKLDEAYLECRDFRYHAFTWRTAKMAVAKRYQGVPQQVRRVLVCQRCSTERHEVFHVPSWTRISVTYRYPDGYRLPGSGHLPGEEIRRAVFSRVFDVAELEDEVEDQKGLDG